MHVVVFRVNVVLLNNFLQIKLSSISIFNNFSGVSHLARCQVQHLDRFQPELDINERDMNCVVLAGLCHDLGTVIYMHTFDISFSFSRLHILIGTVIYMHTFSRLAV
jgi:hypothetical protein